MSDFMINIACDKALSEISKGNKNAISDIYDNMGRQIYFLAYSILKNHHDAEDVLSIVLCEIAEKAAAYRKGSNARAWILFVARNQALKMSRDRKTHIPLDQLSEDVRYSEDDSEFISLLTMFEALKTLSNEEEQIVILHIQSGMRFREIGELLCIKAATAQKKYRRALEKLKIYYEAE